MQKIQLDKRYLVNIDGTSDGTQDKYFKDEIWYKPDYFGGEGYAEYLASLILQYSSLEETKYVQYEEIEINGKKGCCSKNFLSDNEEFISLYRLYQMTTGENLAKKISTLDLEKRPEFVLDFVKNQTGVDLRTYFANHFALDRIILNEDRHFNNLGIIFDGENFKEAPIFDNGHSFFVGSYSYNTNLPINENVKRVTAKPFSGSHDWNYRYFEKWCTLRLDKKGLLAALQKEPDSLAKKIVLYQLQVLDIVENK